MTPDTAEKRAQSRWLALDAVKTAGLIGTLLAHPMIWVLGTEKMLDGHPIYDISRVSFAFPYFVCVVLLITAAGSAFYFYIEKTPAKNIALRALMIALVGIIFGINIHPFFLFWNIFLFAAIALGCFASMYKIFGIRGIVAATLTSYLAMLVVRIAFPQALYTNFLLQIFAGDPRGIASDFPILPWLSIVGIGFIAAYAYAEAKKSGHEKKYMLWLLLGGFTLITLTEPLAAVNQANAFGTTAFMPLSYPLYFGGLYILCLAIAEYCFKKSSISIWYPIRAVGRHPLAIYLSTILALVGIIGALEKSPGYQAESFPLFLALSLFTLCFAYGLGVWLEWKNLKKA